ncbi:hypothetical protein PMAC_002959 [Pneumocystis sp. 'macacae']|nr:hypothetical protein PMAC_002959 [Pneumocystis sp. 'macacae']
MEDVCKSFDKISLEHGDSEEKIESSGKNVLDLSCRFDFCPKDISVQGYYSGLRFSSIRNVNGNDLKNSYNIRSSQYSDSYFFGMVNGKRTYTKGYDEHSILSTFVLYILEHNVCTYEELLRKEEFRLFLSGVLHNCRPSAKLVLFGSVASRLAVVNSDMDLCVIDDSLDMHTHEFPKILAEEIRKYGSSAFPEGISCDIGFNNKLAIYNTNLLTTYSNCDHRVRKIILFIKYWAKRRKINDPYHGTLSSYGYVLLILHYLMNVIPVPLLPNLQRMKASPGKVLVQSEIECDGIRNYFLSNVDSLGKLVHGFFYYYAYQFNWRDHVVSIRSQTGLLTKKDKGWTQAVERVSVSDNIFRDRYILAIEDPFEITHNVGRTVNRLSAHTIRGEFFRASKLSGSRIKNKIYNELCEERIISDNSSKNF